MALQDRRVHEWLSLLAAISLLIIYAMFAPRRKQAASAGPPKDYELKTLPTLGGTTKDISVDP